MLLRVQDRELTFRGERKMEHEDRKDNYHRVERAYGMFTRTFSLPDSVDAEKIAAECKLGVLRVRIPKKAETMPRQISVKSVE